MKLSSISLRLPTLLFFFFFFFFFHHSSSAPQVTPLQTTCKALEDGHIPYDFCVKTLMAYPGANAANAHGVGVAAVALTLQKADLVHDDITRLQSEAIKGKSDSTKPLEDCSKNFSELSASLKNATKAMEGNKYRDVKRQLVKAMKPASCHAESLAKQKPALSQAATTITRDHAAFSQTADLAYAVVDHLEKGGRKA